MIPNPTPENVDEWYETHGEELRRVVFALLLKLTGSRTIAEDLAQEVIFKVWKYVKRGRSINTHVLALAMAVAQNTFRDHLRKVRARRQMEDEAQKKANVTAQPRSPDDLADDNEMNPIVVECMDKDPDGWLIRARLKGMTYREIEQEYDVPKSIAERRFKSACRRVLDCASRRLRDNGENETEAAHV